MSQTRSGAKIKRIKRYITTTAMIMLFFFSIAPMILAAFPNSSTNQAFSIYNIEYDGLSIVRNDLESITNSRGTASLYRTTSLISNLNALNRFNGSGVLVIVGPAANFDATETFSVLLYLLRGGSLIIADDFGTGNQILEPIFDLFENLDEVCVQAQEQGIDMPCLEDILEGGVGDDTGENSTLFPDQFDDPGDLAGSIDPSNFLMAILKTVKSFGFNSTGVLMDAYSNDGNPNRPLITDIESTYIEGMTFTQNVGRIQMEMGSVISVKLKITEEVFNQDTGQMEEVEKIVWQPLQKISASLINGAVGGGDDNFELGLPFFPLYSSRSSWIETDMAAAADGTATPDPDEWGNAKFATALTIPLFPGMGKIVFIADPSIFINRWTEQTDKNDNLILIRNIIEMATSHQEITLDMPQIPIIFDFGHTYQSLLSPILYSTALLKLIAQMSMFPLYAPFVPFIAYGYGKKIMPKSRRLRPILLTKRRGEKGHSDFEKKLALIKDTGAYGGPIRTLTQRLKVLVRTDPRYEGEEDLRVPRDMARFFMDNYPSHTGSRRALESQLKALFAIYDNPTRRISFIAAKRYLGLVKKYIDLLDR